MKVGIDLRALQVGHEFRGIGAHVRSLVEAMFANEEFAKNTIYIYMYDTTNPIETIRVPENLKLHKVLMKNPKDPRENTTKQQKASAFAKEILLNHFKPNPFPDTSKLDVFVQFDQALGLPKNPRLKKVLFVYDFIPLAFKSSYLPGILSVNRRLGWRAALKTYAMNTRYNIGLKTVKKADKLIVPSNFTKQDATKYLGIKPEKIIVAPCSIPTIALKKPVDLKKKRGEENLSEKKKIVEKITEESEEIPYLLYVGGVESPRRRLDDLVGAYHQLRANGIKTRLVLVGRELGSVKTIPNTATVEQLKQDSYKDDLFMLGYLDDQSVDKLYKHAKAFVFVSLYEGFGLPILESYAKNCPVVTYDNSSITEVAGGAAIICKPNLNSLTDTLKGVIKGKLVADESAMREQLTKFSWKESAKILQETINN